MFTDFEDFRPLTSLGLTLHVHHQGITLPRLNCWATTILTCCDPNLQSVEEKDGDRVHEELGTRRVVVPLHHDEVLTQSTKQSFTNKIRACLVTSIRRMQLPGVVRLDEMVVVPQLGDIDAETVGALESARGREQRRDERL